MRHRFRQRSALADAAEACATSGNVEKVVKVALNIERLSYEAMQLLNSTTLLIRCFGTFADRPLDPPIDPRRLS